MGTKECVQRQSDKRCTKEIRERTQWGRLCRKMSDHVDDG